MVTVTILFPIRVRGKCKNLAFFKTTDLPVFDTNGHYK